jgi:hypothetical protein
MTKSLLLPAALLSALAIAATGCAHRPPAPLSSQVIVMQMAADLGYNIPNVVNGQTLYCKNEALTGSMISRMACLNADQIMAQARAQGIVLRYLSQAPTYIPRPGALSSP